MKIILTILFVVVPVFFTVLVFNSVKSAIRRIKVANGYGTWVNTKDNTDSGK